jgi:peptidylprolyl isomerase
LANSQFFSGARRRGLSQPPIHRLGQVVSGMENVDKIKRGEPVRDPDKIVKATLS